MSIEIKVRNIALLVPESDDPCELWVGYFKALKTMVGTDNARTIWLVTWKTNGAASCTTDGGFNTWLQKNKIDVSSAATRAIADASEIGSNFMGLGKNISKIISIAVPLTLALALTGIGVILWNTAKKSDATDLIKLTPIGSSIGGGIKLLNK